MNNKFLVKSVLNYYHPLLFIPTHTGKLYKNCICYNFKVECNCGKLVNRTNLNKHLKICVQKIKQKKVNDTIDTNDIIIDTDTNHKLNRTLIVGPSFCGKAHLLLNN